MSLVLTIIIVFTGFLALYWVFYGQRKYNEMFIPKRKTELKAILFDLDGVIIDSFEAWFHVVNGTKRKYKLREFDEDEFKKRAWGKILNTELKHIFPKHDPNEVKKRYRTLILKHADKIKLLPNAKKVLEKIKKKQLKIGLVTNNFSEPTKKVLEIHKIDKYFGAVVTAEDVERPKPFPDAVLKACEKLNVMPDEVIYVGDNTSDYKAGKAAGCLVVGLNTTGDLIISKLKDLLEII